MSKVSTSRILASTAATGWVAKLLAMAVSLVTLPIVVTTLGTEKYGVWVLTGQIIGFIALADLGVTNSLGRFVARSRVSGDQRRLQELLSTAGVLLLGAALVVVLLTLILAPLVPGWLGIGSPHRAEATTIFMIVGLALALQFPLRLGTGVLAGYHRYGVQNSVKILSLIVHLLGIILLARTGRLELIPLALLSALTTVGEHLVLLGIGFVRIGGVALGPRSFSRGVAREVLGLGASALNVSLSSAVYRQGSVTAVGLLLGVRAAGIYGIVLTLVTHVSSMLMQMVRPMMTLASEWRESGDLVRLRRSIFIVMRVALALAITAAAGLAIYGAPFLRLLLAGSDWSTTEFQTAGAALALMGIGLAVGMPQMVSRSVLQGVGMHWSVSHRFMIASFGSLLVGVLLMRSGFGLMGAAAGWSLVWVLQGTVLYPPLICRFLGESGAAMLREAYLPAAVLGAGVVVLIGLIATVLEPVNWPALISGGMLSALAGCAGALILAGKGSRVRRRLLHGGTPA